MQSAYELLQQAQQARRAGDKHAARRLASQAAQLAPQWEEPWIMLGALASPSASVAYMQKALELNPQSQSAQKGMAWAQKRAAEQPARAQPASAPQPAQPIQSRKMLAAELPAYGQLLPVTSKALIRKQPHILAILIIVVCMAAALLIWVGNASPVLAFFREIGTEQTANAPSAGLEVEKAPYTPTVTDTPVPTATFTLTPTFTPTATYTPTQTPLPTETTFPTETPVPTETPDPRPTATVYVYVPPDMPEGERWIDVDLTNQMVYAYVGNTMVNAFVVSTGTWQHPTVTGEFRIWHKTRYTDMSGPDYYLPNVPYTMFFYKDYALHGTYWHNNFGVPMSHGCVNLSIPDAAWLFDFASLGTLVRVHY